MDEFELYLNGIYTICRGCLKEKPDMEPINEQLKLMLDTIGEIKIKHNNLPRGFCTDCIFEVDRAYTFLHLLRKSESILLHFFKSNNEASAFDDGKIALNENDIWLLETWLENQLVARVHPINHPLDMDKTSFKNVFSNIEKFNVPRLTKIMSLARSFKCKKCYAEFKTKVELCKHEMVHKDFVEENQSLSKELLICDICNDVFTESTRLAAHMLIHPQEKFQFFGIDF